MNFGLGAALTKRCDLLGRGIDLDVNPGRRIGSQDSQLLAEGYGV